jgi:hypothetical protein
MVWHCPQCRYFSDVVYFLTLSPINAKTDVITRRFRRT